MEAADLLLKTWRNWTGPCSNQACLDVIAQQVQVAAQTKLEHGGALPGADGLLAAFKSLGDFVDGQREFGKGCSARSGTIAYPFCAAGRP